jgi:hypothetical protein
MIESTWTIRYDHGYHHHHHHRHQHSRDRWWHTCVIWHDIAYTSQYNNKMLSRRVPACIINTDEVEATTPTGFTPPPPPPSMKGLEEPLPERRIPWGEVSASRSRRGGGFSSEGSDSISSSYIRVMMIDDDSDDDGDDDDEWRWWMMTKMNKKMI